MKANVTPLNKELHVKLCVHCFPCSKTPCSVYGFCNTEDVRAGVQFPFLLQTSRCYLAVTTIQDNENLTPQTNNPAFAGKICWKLCAIFSHHTDVQNVLLCIFFLAWYWGNDVVVLHTAAVLCFDRQKMFYCTARRCFPPPLSSKSVSKGGPRFSNADGMLCKRRMVGTGPVGEGGCEAVLRLSDGKCRSVYCNANVRFI